MYILGCRAHFCNLPGLGQIGHFPNGKQWEFWDPGLGPNVVRLHVHLPPANALDTPWWPQCTTDTIYTPCQHPATPACPAIPWHPIPQNRNLVVKSSATAHEHDMSWACGSGCCFVRCTPHPLTSLKAPRERYLVARSGINWGPVDLSSCSIICNRPSCLLLLSVCNWPFSWVHPVYNIPSLVVKSMFLVLWSSSNFCNISQNIHSKAPLASQHWKANKVVWTWKDDWPPWRTQSHLSGLRHTPW